MRIVSVLRPQAGADEFPLFRLLLRRDQELINFDDRVFGFREVAGTGGRFVRRLERSGIKRRFNDELCRYIRNARPRLFVVFKGPHLEGRAVEAAKEVGARTVVIYPDLDPRLCGVNYIAAVRLAELFYSTKQNLQAEFTRHIREDARFITPPYSRVCLGGLRPAVRELGALFVGNYSQGKARSISAFGRRWRFPITIVGDGWEKSGRAFAGNNIRVVPPLFGPAVYELMRSAPFNLGLLMESISAGWEGDQVTSRSVVVPARGGVLLHPDTPIARRLYGAECEALFSDLEVAVQLGERLMRDPRWRERVFERQRESVLRNATCWEDLVEEWL